MGLYLLPEFRKPGVSPDSLDLGRRSDPQDALEW
jgi:hypothetical protein